MYDVEIIGPDFGPGLWPPCNLEGISYQAVPSQNYIQYLYSAQKLIFASKAQIIYAIKPLITSYGLALLIRLHYKTPVILDIDDWELGMAKWRLRQSKTAIVDILKAYWVGWTFFLERKIKRADKITVSGSFLQGRYGGVIIPHGRDTTYLNPTNFDSEKLRSTHRFKNEKILLFLGTPRPHKGIEDLIKAVQLIPNKDIKILLVGANHQDEYTQQLLSLNEPRLIVIPMRPLSEAPNWLTIADIVVIPQRASLIAKGQTPAKLYDAMSMAKPIISTDVADIPSILENCGFIVPPDDIQALADKISYVLQNPKTGHQMGLNARQKCIKQYSWKIMQKKLINIFEPYNQKTVSKNTVGTV
ncbi:glycosyltransferase family 4 protein [Anaerolineales bacterium HSG6]|nr:glycosyltransferase family 4 protein [Anaerolineales bacterium HSG6]MDM8531054.1 glycosyltransferase family 4 protein [Anaerolineales bacterium HSG25]